jgi:uncharacterized protein YneF (UPF0154 family)
MDTPGTIALIAFALILGCFFAARMIAAVFRNRPKLRPLSEYQIGDCRLSKIINGGE